MTTDYLMACADDAMLAALDGQWRYIRDLSLPDNSRLYAAAGQRLRKLGLVESKMGPGYNLMWRKIDAGQPRCLTRASADPPSQTGEAGASYLPTAIVDGTAKRRMRRHAGPLQDCQARWRSQSPKQNPTTPETNHDQLAGHLDSTEGWAPLGSDSDAF